jgi:hypothetical protein
VEASRFTPSIDRALYMPAPNAGGAGDQIGNVYAVSIRPLDTSQNPMSTDIANVSCPAF